MLEHYPRDELFQIDEDSLYRFAISILQLDERPRVRVLARRDRFDRFVSVLVYVPRERYDSHIRVQDRRVSGERVHWAGFGFLSVLPGRAAGARALHHRPFRRRDARVDAATLEHEVGNIVRSWTDGLSDALRWSIRRTKCAALFDRYRDAFSAGFEEAYSPSIAAADIRVIERLTEQRPLGVDFHHRLEEEQRAVGLKVWSLARPLPLSERVPVLENMGFRVVDERTYHIAPKGDDAADVWFHDMLLERRDGGMIELGAGRARSKPPS